MTSLNLQSEAGWEEYFDYIFPEDEAAKPNLKLLAMAKMWKKKKEFGTEDEGEPARPPTDEQNQKSTTSDLPSMARAPETEAVSASATASMSRTNPDEIPLTREDNEDDESESESSSSESSEEEEENDNED